MRLTRTDKAGLLSFGQAAEFLARLVVAGILARYLSRSDNGVFRLLWVVYFLLIPFFYVGLDPAIYYFWPKAGREGRRELVLQSLLLHTAAGLLFAVIMFGGASVLAWCWRMPEIEAPLRAFSLFPLLAMPALASQAFLMSADRPILAAVMSFANRVTPSLVCGVALAAFALSLTTTFLLVDAAAALILIIALVLSLRQAGGSPFRWDWRRIREQVRFALPMGTPAIASSLSQRLGQLIVPFFYSSAGYAAYSLGSIELPVFTVLTTPANVVILPEMSAHAAAGRTDLLIDVWHRAIRKVAFLILPATAFLLAYARETILILFSSEYADSIPIFMILLGVLPTQIANFMTPLMLMKRSRIVAIGSIISIGTLAVLSLTLIPLLRLVGDPYGLWAAGAAAVLSHAVYTGYFVVQTRRVLGASSAGGLGASSAGVLPWRYLGVTSGLAALAAGASLLVKLLHWAPVPQFLVGGVAFCLVFGPLALVTGIFPELERERLRKLWRAVTGS